MRDDIFIAGAGGQGIIIAGKILAQAAVEEDKFVTYFPSYGAEVRGGTANCDVIISDKEIGSPVVSKASSMIIMNIPSFNKFLPKMVKDGMLIVNTSLVQTENESSKIKEKTKNFIGIPATQIAHDLGNLRCANIVMLGVYLKTKKTVSPESVIKAIKVAFTGKEDIIKLNIKALEKGLK